MVEGGQRCHHMKKKPPWACEAGEKVTKGLKEINQRSRHHCMGVVFLVLWKNESDMIKCLYHKVVSKTRDVGYRCYEVYDMIEMSAGYTTVRICMPYVTFCRGGWLQPRGAIKRRVLQTQNGIPLHGEEVLKTRAVSCSFWGEKEATGLHCIPKGLPDKGDCMVEGGQGCHHMKKKPPWACEAGEKVAMGL
ncbi:hypothetical protein GOP47_0029067 [Adiantum capillus-veneris]|nr:hypothetical protein GOP47_0029067 [Adiantum capillus-veneris]